MRRRGTTTDRATQETGTAALRRWCVAAAAQVVGAACCLAPASTCLGAASFEAVLVRFDADNRQTISRVDAPAVQLAPNELGIVVWADEGGQRWQVFRGSWSKPSPTADSERNRLAAALGNTRGGYAESPASFEQLTTQLDPLLSPSVIKAIGDTASTRVLTPPNGGAVLGQRLTIRRYEKNGESLPAAVAELSSGSETARLTFKEDQAELAFAEISNRPNTWKDGLPAGKYTLRFDGDEQESTTFIVAPPAQRERVLAWLDEWRRLVGGSDQPLYVFGAVEYLLAQQPLPCLTDALDLLDAQKQGGLTPYLEWRRRHIVSLLRGATEPSPPTSADDVTGIKEIDQARRLIARGRWTDALKKLDAVGETGGSRTSALADLYRAVVHAESGLEEEAAADFYFRRAIAGLSDESAADRFRAHNNYGNFLLNCTQDRLSNHAFQLAAGVRSLFVTALLRWEDARTQYEAALELAQELGPQETAAVEVNLARLYAVLSDVLRTLDSPLAELRQLELAEQALDRVAEQYAGHAIEVAKDVDPYVVSVGEAIRAQLAFRARRAAVGREHALRALDGFVRCGSLAGIETVERMLGMFALRWSQLDAEGTTDKEAHNEALTHFRISHLLAELLRDQIPSDRVGQTRAGFFARRVYVNEQLVELLIEDGKDVEALRFVELAKARALEDLLSTRGGDGTASPHGLQQLETVLATWPKDVIALEYFLTTERAWVFVIDASGNVKAHPLVDGRGRPLVARDLVARVRSYLQTDLNQYAVKSRERILAGQGFDHQWQDTLNRFCHELLPGDVLTQISHADTLLVVPHHILHYFPFVALVTQRDDTPRKPLEMVKPRFLIDEPCNVCYAPSLMTWHMLRQRAASPIDEVAAITVSSLPGAPPLPGVTAELQSLKAAFGRQLKIVVTEEDAHKDNAFSLLRRPGMLLVSTHGRNWPDQPLASELLLYPRGHDDGRLTAAELYKTSVERDLIVLSACYTGLADKSPLPGDDLFGLQRALLQSGSRTVITGQWDIYDETASELMHGFLWRLADGAPVPLALTESQRQFLKRLRASDQPEPWLHPYFWAVYTVAGDDRTTFKRDE
jgi:CHAT domain-containing protein/tetratricopeptide (TPR) repeat protein